jgi:hypothetical protein
LSNVTHLLAEPGFVGGDRLEHTFAFESSDVGNANGGRGRMTAPGRTMGKHRVGFRRQDIANVPPEGNAPKRLVRRGDPFGERQHVRQVVIAFGPCPGTQPPKPTDHFVRDHQDAVLVAQATDFIEVSRWRRQAPTSVLDGFDEDGCNLIRTFSNDHLLD